MRNLILSIALASMAIFFGATNIYAQKGQTRIGIKAGLSVTTLGAFDYPGLFYDYNFRPGFQAGVFLETPISKSVLFSPQVLFTQKGGNVNTTSQNGIILKGSTQVNYIDVPLLVGFKAYPKLIFYGGPQMSFLASEHYILTIGKSTVTSTETTGTRKIVFGGNVGAGYKVTSNLGLNINCIFDVTPTFEEAYDGGEKNRGFVFTLGYSF
ncbi:hypothetical protein GCM10027049_25430 [Mucilaginibacter puniceus]